MARWWCSTASCADNFKGQRTLYLEYESYEPMAYAKIQEIGAEIHQKYPIHRVGMVHRLGRLEIGETSMVIVITSAHRAAAFDACRYAIDTLKRVVPIWKKEYFAGGAVWAEGEKSWQEAISRRERIDLLDEIDEIDGIELSRDGLGAGGEFTCRLSHWTIGRSPRIPQAAAAQKQHSAIRIQTDLVNILASVIDANGEPMIGLPQTAFQLFEEDVEQKIVRFEPQTNRPLDLALLVDASGSATIELKIERDAAERFVKEVVRPGRPRGGFFVHQRSGAAVQFFERP